MAAFIEGRRASSSSFEDCPLVYTSADSTNGSARLRFTTRFKRNVRFGGSCGRARRPVRCIFPASCDDGFLGVVFIGLPPMLQLLRSPLGQWRSFDGEARRLLFTSMPTDTHQRRALSD